MENNNNITTPIKNLTARKRANLKHKAKFKEKYDALNRKYANAYYHKNKEIVKKKAREKYAAKKKAAKLQAAAEAAEAAAAEAAEADEADEANQ